MVMDADFNLNGKTPGHGLKKEMMTLDQEGKRGHSWIVEILPQIEQQGLADRYDKKFSPLHNIMRNNFEIVDIPGLYCPSRRHGVETPEQQYMLLTFRGPGQDNDDLAKLNITVGGTDYGAAIAAGNCEGNTSKDPLIGYACVGVTGAAASPMTPLRRGEGSSLAKVTDGTSHTLMLGELQRIWAADDDPRFAGQSGDAGVVSGRSDDGWVFGGSTTMFTTSVTTTIDGVGDTRDSPGGLNDWFFEHPGSDHVGGAHLAYADGSVHFVSENVDPLILMAETTRAGGELASDEGAVGNIAVDLEALFTPPSDGPGGGRR